MDEATKKQTLTYLERIVPVLEKGLSELSIAKPEDPYAFLAVHLINESKHPNASRAAALLSASTPSSSPSLPSKEGDTLLASNAELLSEAERGAVALLVRAGQEHVVASWPAKGTKDDDKKRLCSQVIELEGTVAGGLEGYVSRAKKLLQASKDGFNPYEGYVPSTPAGVVVSTADDKGLAELTRLEKLGMTEIQTNGCGFVLVAGGLGERLGYHGIKIELPTETTTEKCYLAYYCQHILALQARARTAGNKTALFPLAIMTSGDTNEKTMKLLKDNNDFGMAKGQITIVEQKLVPSLSDNDAHFVLSSSDPFVLETKPHGHGDVHTLLYKSGLPAKWAKESVKWVLFLQDTNGLVFRGLPAAIGVSSERNFVLNTMTVPRKPGEAVGAICSLKKGDKHLVINVEYNQIAALMEANGVKEEVTATGHSTYPGNTNTLLLQVAPYAAVLAKSKGIVPEFVNPKYADDAKTKFKKPTRLECMMQDIPLLLEPSQAVGFTQFERFLAFSPVKNNIVDASKKGIPDSASSGEADMYRANRWLLHAAGVRVDVKATGGGEQKFGGVPTLLGAKVVLSPAFGSSTEEVRGKVRGTNTVSDTSTLVLDGEGDIHVDGLDLDGTLIVHCAAGCSAVIKDVTIKNEGWCFKEVAEGDQVEEKYAIRGYTMQKKEQVQISITMPGRHIISGQGEVTVDSSTPSKTAATKAIIILVGPPGSGKGTQASVLKAKYNLAHLSTGDMLRAAIKAESDVGKIAKAAIDKGVLVSDDIIVAVIKDAIATPQCERGFILDGFPRNQTQAASLDAMLKERGEAVSLVLSLNCPDEQLVERITGRWTHTQSGRSYHVKFNPPKVPGKDDETGEALVQRPDDTAETLTKRLATFHESTTPVLKHYQAIVKTVDACKSPTEVSTDTCATINKLAAMRTC